MGGCPRCADVLLVDAAGVLHEAVCPSCDGRFLGHAATERILVEEQGIDPATLKELASMFGGAILPCPGCEARMRPVTLRGTPIDVCFTCGGSWLDAGELSQLTGGRHREISVAAPPAADVDASVDAAPQQALRPGGSAVFLGSADELAAELIADALAPFGQFTRNDYPIIARNALGVLLEGTDPHDCAGVVERLAAAGVPSVVDDADWLHLPRRAQMTRVDLRDGFLIPFDQYGREQPRPMGEVETVAVGVVEGAGPAEGSTGTLKGSRKPSVLVPRFLGANREVQTASDMLASLRATRRRDQRGPTTVLEVVFTDGTRMHARAETTAFPQLAEAGLAFDRHANMREVALRILAQAPHASMTRGAGALTLGGEPLVYRGLKYFERELAWTRWARQREARR